MSITLDYRILMPVLASYSEKFVKQVLLAEAAHNAGINIQAKSSFIEALKVPLQSAKIFFGNYAFVRAGGEQARYNQICIHLLRDGFKWQDSELFYREFVQECRNRNIGPNERNNRGVVTQGYKAHIQNQKGWLFVIGEHIANSHQVGDIFCKLLKIKGIGSKIAALICRDLVWVFDCESQITAFESPLLQPVDTWIWQVCKEFWGDIETLKKLTKGGVFWLLCV